MMLRELVGNIYQNPVAWIALATSMWSIYRRHILAKMSVDRRVKFDYIFWKLKTFNELLFHGTSGYSSATAPMKDGQRNGCPSLAELARTMIIGVSCVRFLLTPENNAKLEKAQTRYEKMATTRNEQTESARLLEEIGIILRAEMESAATILKDIDSKQMP